MGRLGVSGTRGSANPFIPFISTSEYTYIPYSGNFQVNPDADPVPLPFDALDIQKIKNNRFTVSFVLSNDSDDKNSLRHLYMAESYTHIGRTMYTLVDFSLQLQNTKRSVFWHKTNDVIDFACTAKNTFYVLGNGTVYSLFQPQSLSLPVRVDKIWCGETDSVFVYARESNELYAMGPNKYGELGVADMKPRNTFTKVPLPGESWIQKVCAGHSHTYIYAFAKLDEQSHTTNNLHLLAGNNNHRQCVNSDDKNVLQFYSDTRLRNATSVCVTNKCTFYVESTQVGSSRQYVDRVKVNGEWNDPRPGSPQWPENGFTFKYVEDLQCHGICYVIHYENEYVYLSEIDAGGEITKHFLGAHQLKFHVGFGTRFVIEEGQAQTEESSLIAATRRQMPTREPGESDDKFESKRMAFLRQAFQHLTAEERETILTTPQEMLDKLYEEDCCVCMEPLHTKKDARPITSECAHTICEQCERGLQDTQTVPKCPKCRAPWKRSSIEMLLLQV